MKQKNYKQCSSCFFSTKFPNVNIDEDLKCNFCTDRDFISNLKARTDSDITELHNIAEKIKRQNKGKYDCIIGASGGLDSSYVIYVAKKVLDLNPLVIKYDHGFNYAIADENLMRICKKLNVDFKIIKSKKQNDLKYIKYIVKGLSGMGHYWGVCSFCHYILPAVIYKYAIEEGIPAILSSSNIYEENLYLGTSFKIKFLIKSLFKVNIFKWPLRLLYIAIARYYLLKLKLEFYLPPISNLWSSYPKCPPIIQVNITKYLSWEIDKIVNALENECGWKPPNKKLPMRFDCKIEDSLINRTYKNAAGITVHGIICNNLIYDDLRTRDELQEVVDEYDNSIEMVTKELMDRLKLK